MPESFGARLRQQREQQQIALTTIAEQTKISVSLMEGLERGDVSHWPSGIFRRSFMRAYAQAIGLDPDPIVREFLERYPDPNEQGDGLAAVVSRVGGTSRPPTRFRYVVGSAIDSFSRLRPSRRRVPLEDLAEADCRPGSVAPGMPLLADVEPGPVHEVAEHPEPIAEAPLVAEPAPDCYTGSVVSPEPDPDAVLVLEVSEDPAPGPIAEPAHERGDTIAPGSEAVGEPDLLAAAELCTEFGRVADPNQAGPLLGEAARILDAPGLIVWAWDPQAAELRAALAHGYPDRMLAQLPRVGRDADNPTAAAFRAGQMSVVAGSGRVSGAVVAPIMTGFGCAGVLAIELRRGSEQRDSVRALATIFAAQLAKVIGAGQAAAAADRRLA